MKSVRIEPAGARTFAVDVVCDCGRNGLEKAGTGETSFRHLVTIGESRSESFTLRCSCGRAYQVVPQGSHVHVHDLSH